MTPTARSAVSARPRFVAFLLAAAMAVGILMHAANDATGQTATGQLRVIDSIRQDDVFELAWSPDGRYIAGLLPDTRGYVVWDARTLRKVRESRSGYGNSAVRSLEFTPDSKHLIIEPSYPPPLVNGVPVALAFWNVETGAIDRVLTASTSPTAFAIGGGRIAVLYGGTRLDVFAINSLQLVASWTVERTANESIAIDTSGRAVAIGGGVLTPLDYRGESYGRIWVYDVESGRATTTIDEAHKRAVLHLTFLGSTGLLASSSIQNSSIPNHATNLLERLRDPDPVRIWDTRDGRMVRSFLMDLGRADALIASPDGTKLGVATTASERVGGEPGVFRTWEVASGREVGSMHGDRAFFTAAAFSPDGRRAAVSRATAPGDPFEVVIVEFSDK